MGDHSFFLLLCLFQLLGLASGNASAAALSVVFSGSVLSVAISTDGQMVVSGEQDGTVRIWDINFEPWLKVACDRLRYHPVFVKPETPDEKEAKATCEPYFRQSR